MAKHLDESHLESLMTLLAVARLGRFTAAAKTLQVNHSTVSRRIAHLEDAMRGRVIVKGAHGWELTELGTRAMAVAERIEHSLGQLTADDPQTSELQGLVRVAAPDAFTVYIAMPALAWLQRRQPGLVLEVVSATQQARQRRAGMDIEVVVGRPLVHRAVTQQVFAYRLRLYATPEYLQREGEPQSLADLADHRINYYIESALQVDDLDLGLQRIPNYRLGISSTSVFAHVAATVAGSGIGLLPDYVGDRTPGLVRVLERELDHPVAYWAALRQENDRNPAVGACLAAITSYAQSRDFLRTSASGAPPQDV